MPDDRRFGIVWMARRELATDLGLADSFNELDVPVPTERGKRLGELAEFGKAVYDGIRAGNPDGTWVNPDGTYWESNPVMATSRAVLALAHARNAMK